MGSGIVAHTAKGFGAVTLYSHYETTDLGNGQIKHEQHIKPIAYSKNGAMTRIMNSIGATGDPAFPVGVDELVQFRIKDKLAGQSPVVHFGKGLSMVRFTPLGTNNTNGVQIGDNGWRYPEAWNNCDLDLIIAGHRLQKNITLRNGHPSSFQFRIDENTGLDFDTLETGDFRILQPYLTDGFETVALEWQKEVQGGKLILTVNLPVGDWAGWTLDPTLVLQPDAADGVDTFLVESLSATNFALDSRFQFGSRIVTNDISRALIKFDLSSIPVVSNVSSATLTLWLQQDGVYRASNNRVLYVYRQKRQWVENEATWNIYSTGNSWQSPGGFGVDDAEQTDIGSASLQTSDIMGSQHDFVLLQSAVVDWINGDFANNGLIAKSAIEDEDLYIFSSSDYTTASQRPKLTIVYTVGGGLLPILQQHGVYL